MFTLSLLLQEGFAGAGVLPFPNLTFHGPTWLASARPHGRRPRGSVQLRYERLHECGLIHLERHSCIGHRVGHHARETVGVDFDV